MAEDLKAPSAQAPLTAGAGLPSRPWFTFWSLVGQRLTALGGVSPVATADATDPATTMALVNELKAKLNEVVNSQQ